MDRLARSNESSSLELLLDTICNLFGGMILLAILVVMQTQRTVDRIPQDAGSTEVHLEIRKLDFEYERLRDEVMRIENQKTHLDDIYHASASPNVNKLLDTKREFLEAIKEANERLVGLQKDLSYSTTSSKELKNNIDNIEQQAEAKQKQIQSLEQEIINANQQLPKDVRLPHRQSTYTKSPRYYVVKGRRVYPYGGKGRLTGTPYESEDCLVTPLPGSGHIFFQAIKVEPVKGKGIAVPEKRSSNYIFLTTLKECRSSTHYVVFFVYNDSESFRSFQKLKKIVLDRGFLFSVSASLLS